MKLSDELRNKLLAQLIIDEGLRLKPYKDTFGNITIGIGRNLSAKGITKNEAIYLCNNDITAVRDFLYTFKWSSNLSDNRVLALCNMIFNIGNEGFLEFKGLIAALEKEDYAGASLEMLNSKWASEVGDRAKRLANLMLNG